MVKRVSSTEAIQLVADEGYALLDVRSIPEYGAGHPEGACNIPLLHKTSRGLLLNHDFSRLVKTRFAETAKIITVGEEEDRSTRAATELTSRGYKNVLCLEGGFGDLAVTTQVEHGAERSYAAINRAANRQAPIPDEGRNRFASSKRMVDCVVLGKTLPGLKRRPYPGPLGERIFTEISAAAWDLWAERSKMVINEYRLNSADPDSLKMLMELCSIYLFGDDPLREQ